MKYEVKKVLDGSKRYAVKVVTNKLLNQEENIYYMLHEYILEFIFSNPENKYKLALIYLSNGKTFEMSLSELLFHIYIWRPNVIYNKPILESDLYDLYPITDKDVSFKVKFDKIMTKVTRKTISFESDMKKVSYIIANIIENMCTIGDNFGFVANNTFSLYDIYMFMGRDPKFKNLIDTKISDEMTHRDTEVYLKQKTKELESVIKEDKQSTLFPYIVAGSTVRTAQLSQMFIAVGTRPSIDGTIMPTIVKDGYIKGLNDINEFYVEATTSLNALIKKKKGVPDAGYLSRKMYLLCIDTEIDYSVDDCGTKNHEEVILKNYEHLKYFEGKYRIVYDKDKNKSYVPITLKDKHLIGQVIHVRSHIYCALDDGKVCKTCFGSKSNLVKGTRIGGLPPIKVGNPITQKVMSVKHQTTTNSKEITNKHLKRFFIIKDNELTLKPEFYKKEYNIRIKISSEALEELMDFDIDFTDESIQMNSKIEEFYIIMSNEEDEDVEFLIENDGLYMNTTDYLQSLHKKFDKDIDGNVILHTHKLIKGKPLFTLTLLDDDVTKYFSEAKRMIDSAKSRDYETAHDLLMDIVNLSIANGVTNVNIIHFETILYNLIRSVDKPNYRPNFKKFKPPYQLMSMSSAILSKPNVAVGLAFEDTKSFLTNPYTYTDKNKKGIFDCFFDQGQEL